MRALNDILGEVNAEKFIYLINKDNFDYTEWQKDLYQDMNTDEILNMADKYYKERYPEEFKN
ncbi:MAG: hypothetical protein FWD23_07860 [Oscillospiraceae bacterium]|nr:hypothetical protein [Oscillospiraceae bacterium]